MIASLKLGQGKQERALKTNSQAKGGREGTDSILKSNRALLSEEGSELGSGTCLHELIFRESTVLCKPSNKCEVKLATIVSFSGLDYFPALEGVMSE